MECKIEFFYEKWHCIDASGKEWCAFTKHEDALKCAKAHGFIALDRDVR